MMLFRKSTQIIESMKRKTNLIGQLRYLYDFSVSSETQKALDEASELKQKIEENYNSADIDLKTTLHQKLRSLWTYHSNAIEGSTLSLNDTIFFLREGITVEGKPLKDFLDAKNHAEAIDFMYDIITEKQSINASLIKSINAILLQGVSSTPAIDSLGRKTHKPLISGDYKKMPNHVLQPDGTIHRYIEPLLVPEEMDRFFQWIEQNLQVSHPVVTASVAHYNMVRIHPFDDGNGRGARILMNLILLRKQYSPAVIKIEERRKYLECLKQADSGNIEPFIQFVVNSLNWTQRAILEELHKYQEKPASRPQLR